MAKNKKTKNTSSTSSSSNSSADGRKYKFVSSVKVPDMSDILLAASDFDSYGVADVVINKQLDMVMTPDGHMKAVPQGIDEIQKLGRQVAEEEERLQEERRIKMQQIMNNAVSTPQSVEDLRVVASSKLSDERRKIVEKEMSERLEQEAVENAKQEAREERRKMQQRAVVDLLIKKENKAVNTSEAAIDDNLDNRQSACVTSVINPITEERPNQERFDSEVSLDNNDEDDFFASLYDENQSEENIEVESDAEEIQNEVLPQSEGNIRDSFEDFL